MTTVTHERSGSQTAGLRVAAVQPVHAPSHRLRVTGHHSRVHWWHPRMTLGLTIVGAMIGALLGVALGYQEFGITPVALLEAYGATAGLGAALGLVLGLALGLLAGLVERYLLPQSVHPRHVWVRYRRSR